MQGNSVKKHCNPVSALLDAGKQCKKTLQQRAQDLHSHAMQAPDVSHYSVISQKRDKNLGPGLGLIPSDKPGPVRPGNSAQNPTETSASRKRRTVRLSRNTSRGLSDSLQNTHHRQSTRNTRRSRPWTTAGSTVGSQPMISNPINVRCIST